MTKVAVVFGGGIIMDIRSLDHKQVLDILPDRDPFAHKGDFGKILLLCGSRGYTGAVALAAMGCLRCGAGLVWVGVPECIYAVEAVKLTEPIVTPLPSEGNGFSVEAVEALPELLLGKDVVLVGPGLGQSEGALAVLQYVMTQFHGAVIIDADGINLLSRHIDLLRGRKHTTILTPHEGEFTRLDPEFSGDRLRSAARFASEYGCVMVLKGHETLITDGNVCYQNNTGNPGMAVGGSGDVLAGMIAGLVGQHIDILPATAAAVWLHGASADVCAADMGQYAMLPTDYLSYLPRLMK